MAVTADRPNGAAVEFIGAVETVIPFFKEDGDNLDPTLNVFFEVPGRIRADANLVKAGDFTAERNMI
jgi:hypothetical protein